MPQPRVLVVDDDGALLHLLELLLLDDGYEVDTASNGAEALERLEDCRPDAIVLDLNMPVMDGPEFYRRLRSLPDPAKRVIPVVIISALRATQTMQDLGAEAAMSKPFDDEQLLATIREVVAATR